MRIHSESLPDDFPTFLKHSDDDAPVPGWEQVTRSATAANREMVEHVSRIVAASGDESVARSVWEGWPANYRRSVALLVEKIYSEGWLGSVGPIKGYPWDGGFFFWPRDNDVESLARMFDSIAESEGTYSDGRLSNGLFAYLNMWGHWGWRRGWMENDSEMAALHVGIFRTGEAEVHFDLFNPLYINGAPRADVIRIPVLGAYNHRMWLLHRRWENKRYGSIARRSANFYHILGRSLPLPF